MNEKLKRAICIGIFSYYDELSLKSAIFNWDNGYSYGAIGSDANKDICIEAEKIYESLKYFGWI